MKLRVPIATYRVQLSEQFGFRQLADIIPYLSKLGISDIYASPIFQTKRGGTNGYEITDSTRIDEKLGGREEFEQTQKEAARYGIGWIQDIVPNHMAYTPESPAIWDVMEHGQDSKFNDFLDVDWNHPNLRGKILAPFLDKPYQECLKQKEIKLSHNGKFIANYNNVDFPIRKSSIEGELKDKHHPKEIADINADLGLLDEVLTNQFFKLTYWKSALSEINYRRFFDIIVLICLRQEIPSVFKQTHNLIISLIAAGKFTGLRVDHVDGLREPDQYLRMLRGYCPDAYLLVEKILSCDEELRSSWPVQGTTGYDFLNLLNSVFVDGENEKKFGAIHAEFTGFTIIYNDLLFECKKLVAQHYFGGDMTNLARLFLQVLSKREYGRDCTFGELRNAIKGLVCSFKVYRTYISSHSKESKKEEQLLLSAFHEFSNRTDRVSAELESLEKLLNEIRFSEDALACFTRLQQFTGPIMAKGFEDTMLYRYTRLLSLNEVGGSPERFGISVHLFHSFNARRQERLPLTLNATTTHDTKRGEDVRARLNVLSEMPDKFRSQVKKWTELNSKKKRSIDGKEAPDKSEEFYMYQTLLGTLPFDSSPTDASYIERVKNHMIKAVREGKQNSSWLEPNLAWEDAVISFVNEILDLKSSATFIADFLAFQKEIEFYGVYNSLSQTLLKITCPGVPDFYQGSELWDLNMVDPDNRRITDYGTRKRLLKEVLNFFPTQNSLGNILGNYSDGKVKLFTTQRALVVRKEMREVFESGVYTPIKAVGRFGGHVIAFCRRKHNQSVIVAVPRLLTKVVEAGKPPVGEIWTDTRLCLPQNFESSWINTFTDENLRPTKVGDDWLLPMSDVFHLFPLSLLVSE